MLPIQFAQDVDVEVDIGVVVAVDDEIEAAGFESTPPVAEIDKAGVTNADITDIPAATDATVIVVDVVAVTADADVEADADSDADADVNAVTAEDIAAAVPDADSMCKGGVEDRRICLGDNGARLGQKADDSLPPGGSRLG